MLILVWFKRSLYYLTITTDDVTIGRRDEDFSQGGVLQILSDRDDRMGPNIKTPKNPMPNF